MRPLADITTLEFAQSKKRFERKSCVRSFSTFISARGKDSLSHGVHSYSYRGFQ